MKKKFSLTRLMHNDKWMMLVSLVLAIVVWALVVYGPGNTEDQVITGVPVSVTLSEYASGTLNLRITDGAAPTATVTVRGLRSVISRLSAADITVTADTGSILKEGTYTLPLKATPNGDYSIVGVVGDNGTNDTVRVTCDVWREVAFPVTVEMPKLSLADTAGSQFGTASASGDAITDGQVTVAGPKTDISRISVVAAVIDEEAEIDEATVFTARLEARDENGDVVENVSFVGAEDGKISVTVPVLVYRKIDLSASIAHIPTAYQGKALISLRPSFMEVWGVASELDDYEAAVLQSLQADFDQLTPDKLEWTVTPPVVEGVRPTNENEVLTVKVALKNIRTKTVDLALNSSNISVINCPAGYTVKAKQNKITGITLCGTQAQLGAVNAGKLQVIVDMENTATAGQQTAKARIQVQGQDGVWVYYGETAHAIDLLVTVA